MFDASVSSDVERMVPRDEEAERVVVLVVTRGALRGPKCWIKEKHLK